MNEPASSPDSVPREHLEALHRQRTRVGGFFSVASVIGVSIISNLYKGHGSMLHLPLLPVALFGLGLSFVGRILPYGLCPRCSHRLRVFTPSEHCPHCELPLRRPTSDAASKALLIKADIETAAGRWQSVPADLLQPASKKAVDRGPPSRALRLAIAVTLGLAVTGVIWASIVNGAWTPPTHFTN
jgi:hypothetical protein